jgi:hypothetical protein
MRKIRQSRGMSKRAGQGRSLRGSETWVREVGHGHLLVERCLSRGTSRENEPHRKCERDCKKRVRAAVHANV